MKAAEIKELLTGAITNLESPQPQQWSPEWVAKLRTLAESLPEHIARTHDPYFDDTEPLVDALGFIADHAHDYFYQTRDLGFAKIYNKAMEATGGVARITEDEF